MLACPTSDFPKLIYDLFNSENTGVNYVPRCGGCRCGKCSLDEGLTLREQRQLDLINEGLEYDEYDKCWVADYPWVRDPKELPNNLPLAHARLKSTEKSHQKLGDDYIKNYQSQMEDMVNREIGELEQHTHRFLWRDMHTSVDPDHYVLNTVTFGDKPRGAIAMAALRKTVNRFEDSPEVTNMIVKNTYVDDLLGSVDSRDEAEDLMDRIERVLDKGGFHVKQWIMSGATDGNIYMTRRSTEIEKVLGLIWNPDTDKFVFKLNLRFCKRSNEGHIKKAVKLEELDREIPSSLNKRIILSQVASL